MRRLMPSQFAGVVIFTVSGTKWYTTVLYTVPPPPPKKPGTGLFRALEHSTLETMENAKQCGPLFYWSIFIATFSMFSSNRPMEHWAIARMRPIATALLSLRLFGAFNIGTMGNAKTAVHSSTSNGHAYLFPQCGEHLRENLQFSL
jgi:hypothetical protein